MYAITFDLTSDETEKHFPHGVKAAHAEIDALLGLYQFHRVIDGFYINNEESMTKLLQAVNVLKAIPWFSLAVRDIHSGYLTQWSDLAGVVKN